MASSKQLSLGRSHNLFRCQHALRKHGLSKIASMQCRIQFHICFPGIDNSLPWMYKLTSEYSTITSENIDQKSHEVLVMPSQVHNAFTVVRTLGGAGAKDPKFFVHTLIWFGNSLGRWGEGDSYVRRNALRAWVTKCLEFEVETALRGFGTLLLMLHVVLAQPPLTT